MMCIDYMYVLAVVHVQTAIVFYPLQNISYLFFFVGGGEDGRVKTE